MPVLDRSVEADSVFGLEDDEADSVFGLEEDDADWNPSRSISLR